MNFEIDWHKKFTFTKYSIFIPRKGKYPRLTFKFTQFLQSFKFKIDILILTETFKRQGFIFKVNVQMTHF